MRNDVLPRAIYCCVMSPAPWCVPLIYSPRWEIIIGWFWSCFHWDQLYLKFKSWMASTILEVSNLRGRFFQILCASQKVQTLIKPNYSKKQRFSSSFLPTWDNIPVQNSHGILSRLVLSILDMELACSVLNAQWSFFTCISTSGK